MPLDEFPGALADQNGYLVFQTQSAYHSCSQLRIGARVNVAGGISKIPGYVPRGQRIAPVAPPTPSLPATLLAVDLNDAAHPERRETILQRLIRDTAAARTLKLQHQNRCQICGLAVPLWNGLTYAEAHHIRPLGQPHNGPDLPGNILVLCPNHHAQCDLGAIRLDLTSLRRLPDHVVDAEHIRYHNTTIAK